jgi:ankyrin repeat protein
MKAPQKQSTAHMTELMIAAKVGAISSVRALIKRGVKIDAGCRRSIWEWDKTALMYASENGHAEIVRELLTAEADPNLIDRSISEDSGGKTALHYAAKNGHVGIVSALIDAKSNLEVVDEAASTPLMLACEQGHLKVIESILTNAPDEKARRKMAGDALLSAIAPLGVYRKSVKDGKIVSKRITTPAHVMKVVRLLLRVKPDTNAVSREYGTALECAAGIGSLPLVKLLIESGANPNLRNRQGDCPLRQASEGAHVKVVEYLLERGADPNLRTYDGLTPLIAAQRIGAVRHKKRMVKICEMMEQKS